MIRSILPAGLFAVAVGLWVFSGQTDFLGPPVQAQQTKPAAVLDEAGLRQRVATLPISLQSFQSVIHLTGETAVDRKIHIKSEVGGQVAELYVKRGERVAKGQIIAKIDPDDRPAQLAEARATLSQAEADLEAKANLADKGFGSKIDVRVAQAAVERAKAAVLRAELALENTEIRAPFAGIIEDTLIEPGSFINPAEPLALLLDKDPIKISALAGERQISNLQPGTQADVSLATGQSFPAFITYVASIAEGDTRTFQVELTAKNVSDDIPEGVSADVSLALPERQAHFVPTNTLTLGPADKIGVKAVSDDGHVVFYPITIVDALASGMWVTGLPDQLSLIAQGQDLVSEGEAVDAVALSPAEQIKLGLATQ